MDTTDTRTSRAARHLLALMDLPSSRPGSWEAEHVEALERPLGELLAILTGADDGPDLHGEVVAMRGEVAALRATVAATVAQQDDGELRATTHRTCGERHAPLTPCPS